VSYIKNLEHMALRNSTINKNKVHGNEALTKRDVESESESEGTLGGVGVGKNVSTLTPTSSKILTRYSNSRALIATVTIRLTLKYR
jgi:hypothetical protein